MPLKNILSLWGGLALASISAIPPVALAATGTETILYNFTNGADGGTPYAGLTRVGKTFYGTTTQGGANGHGTIFSITEDGVFSVLYSFKGFPDAFDVQWPMIYQSGALYGFSYQGGEGAGKHHYCKHYDSQVGCGTLFKVTLSGEESIIYAFSSTEKRDGIAPIGSPLWLSGHFYGMTNLGGTTTWGTIFSISKRGKEKILYTFPAESLGRPTAGLSVMNDMLYGTSCTGSVIQIFSITPRGDITKLHAFGNGETCSRTSLLPVDNVLYGSSVQQLFSLAQDGTFTTVQLTPVGIPLGNLVLKGSRFYGVMTGREELGTLFKMDFPAGTSRSVYRFGRTDGDGRDVTNGLVVSGGSFYGVTRQGGKNNYGTIFKISQ